MTTENLLDPNIAQRKASDPQASVWVAANAGTGKTKVLTDRVLSLMLNGTKPHRILCLTFTKAAAAEMANRIADQLGKWSVMEDQSLETTLEDLLRRKPTSDEMILARQLFTHVLDTPGGMQILTIHAFCQSLLKRFPLEANLAPHFEIIEERSAEELLKKAQDDMLLDARLGRTPELFDAIRLISTHTDEDGFTKILKNMTYNRGRLKRLLAHFGGVRNYIAFLANRLGISPQDNATAIIAKSCEQEQFDALGLRVAMDALLNSKSDTDRKRGALLDQWLAASEKERPALFDAYCGAFLISTKNSILKTLITKDALKNNPSSVDVLKVEGERLLRAQDKIRSSTNLQATQALLRIGKTILDSYEKFKVGAAVLDYDDLILKTRDLLSNDNVSWVLYKLDGGIEHLLVDEAQDTNPDQWEVIKSLTQDFFSGLGVHEESEEQPRTVFAVGDSKQSIYSFQGADPKGFDEMRKRFADLVPNAQKIWREVPMTMSFRSTRAILDAVDIVFSDHHVAQGVSFGAEIHHDAWRSKDAGLVEIWSPILKNDPPVVPPWTPPVERILPDSPQSKLANLIAKHIHKLINTKEILESKGRPIEPGDIMVLVQKRKGFVEDFVRALKVLDIPVAGVDRMILGEQLAVMDLIALGRFLLQPDDDLQLACVLKGPLLGLNDDDLFDLAYNRNNASLWSSLRDKAKADLRFHTAHQYLADLLRRTDYVRPFELFTYVLTALNGRKKIISRLGIEAEDPLNEFLNLSLSYERSHTPSLEGFLAWFENGSTEVKRDLEQGDQNAVRIMTVHGAKGLQAPIVYLPDTIRTQANRNSIFWAEDKETGVDMIVHSPNSTYYDDLFIKTKEDEVERQHEENYRLLYVAMTRAEDRLYVSGWGTTKNVSEKSWYHLIKSQMESKAEKVEDDFLNAQEEYQGDHIWRFSCSQEESVIAKAGPKTLEMDIQPLENWAKQPPQKEPLPLRPLTPSRPSDPEPATRSPLGDDHGYRFKRGNLIHALLQTLPELPYDEQAEAARLYLANPVHKLGEKQQIEICEETLRVLNDEQFSDVFSADSQAEVPIVGEVAGRALSAQVDRLLVRDNEVIVVDYKTNRPPPRSVKKVPSLYITQMKAYRNALKMIYPDHHIRCLLLWTDIPKLMELPEDMLEEK